MNSVTIIAKKRDGLELSQDEIRYFINGYTKGEIPDYQASAWCMAVYLQGMTPRETTDLTMAIAESGEMLDLSDTLDFVLDKHSSGGVGDKTSLVVLPLVVSCGVPVAKMSGRGLSFTGGTLDKLESIDGFQIELDGEVFKKQVREHGIVLAGQTGNLAPADGLLYALRDVTGTVASRPLIASSIMSKKIAGGADGIVLDVKTGAGAFMQTVEKATELARLMVDIGHGLDKKVTALISDMNQPLGHTIGNSLELKEAIETLRGGGPDDFIQHCLMIAGQMLRLAGVSSEADLSDIRPTLQEKLNNGEAWEIFRTLVKAQGGDVSQVDNPDKLPIAPIIKEVASEESSYLKSIDAREIGLTALHLGAGRTRKGDPVDHAVGLEVHYKVGEFVEKGNPLFTVHARDEASLAVAEKRAYAAHGWSDRPGMPLFYGAISTED